jgi:outer membrane usher protein
MPLLPMPSNRALRTIAVALSLCPSILLGLMAPAHAQSPTDEAAAAQRPAAAEQPAGQRALLALTVNEGDRGEALAIVREADVLVEVTTLERAGLRNVQGRRETIEGRVFVSLASLAPGVRYEMNERALTLRISAAAELLGAVVIDLSPARPAYEYARSTSGFLNYGVNWSRVAGTNASLDGGVSIGPALAQATMSWDPSRGFVRSLTNVVVDDRQHLRRWTVGDSLVSARNLGSGLLVGGFRVSREYGLDPYFVQFPTLGLSGTALTPSTVEVYVNDRLVSREQVAPGTFDLAHVPMPAGNNATRVVVRDAFGREQQMAAPYYLTTSALARGLHDYDYAVGYPRVGGPSAAWDYGSLSALARHRYGFTDRLTAGFVAEADSSTASAGPTANIRLAAGEIELAASVSRAHGATGAAASAGYAYLGRPVTVSVTLRAMSAGYSTLTIGRALEPMRFEASAMVGAQLTRRASVSLQQALALPHAGELSSRSSIVLSVGVSERITGYVNLSAARENGRSGVTAFGGLSLMVGARTNAGLSISREPTGAGMTADVQRSLPIGSGFGYRTRVASAGGGQAEAMVEAQLPFGHYEAGQDVLNGQSSPHVTANGGLVIIGGGVHPTRPVNDSYALVRVPEVGGVRTYLNNQEVGRTNRRGDTLVPNLLPYYANRLAISDQDVPLDHDVEQVERDVAPPYRGGALVVFRAAARQTLTGTITLQVGGTVIVPAFGEMTLAVGGGTVSSPIGRDGEFYLENLAPGRHQVTVAYKNLTCQVAMDVPASKAPSIQLGTLRCIVPEGEDK